MSAQKETKPVEKHLCFCELCVPTFESVRFPRETDDEKQATPDKKPEAAVALAA